MASAAARESLLLLAQLADDPIKLTAYLDADVFETIPASHSYSVTADAQIFLREFTHAELTRVLTVLHEIPLDDPEMTSEIWMRAAWRQTSMYWAVRRRLVKDARSRIRLTRPHRVGIIQLFLASVKMRRRVAERLAFEASEIAPIDVHVRDFDYVAEARDQPFEAIPNAPLRSHSLRDWITALDLLVRAMASVGDRPPRLVEYWDAIWAQFDEIMSTVDVRNPADADRAFAEDVPAAGSDVAAADTTELDVLVSTWMESLVLDAGDLELLQQGDATSAAASPILNAANAIMPRWDEAGESTRFDDDATPVIHHSARLRLSFCERCESIYYAHSLTLAAAKTYNLAAAQSFPPHIRKSYLKHFTADAAADVWSEFVQSLRRATQWDSMDRGFREGMVPKMAGAHLKRGAMEQYLLQSMERARERGSDIDLETVDTHFKASRVLSETDPEENGHMARQWSSNAALFSMLLDGYLGAPAVGSTGKRLRGERLAALTLLVLVEQDMRVRACPEGLLLLTGRNRAAFIDELEEESIVPSFPPITPWDMTIRSGRTCCLVALMQRYYLVRCSDLKGPRIVLELPTLPAALLAWFTFHSSELEPYIHPLVFARINEIQSRL